MYDNDDPLDPRNRDKIRKEAEAEKKLALERQKDEEERKKAQKKSLLESEIRQVEVKLRTSEFKLGNLRREVELLERNDGRTHKSAPVVKISTSTIEQELREVTREIKRLDDEEAKLKIKLNEKEREKARLSGDEIESGIRERANEHDKAELKREITQNEKKLEEVTRELTSEKSKLAELERTSKRAPARSSGRNPSFEIADSQNKLLIIGREKQDLENKKRRLEQDLSMRKVERVKIEQEEAAAKRKEATMESRKRGRSYDLEQVQAEVDKDKRELEKLKLELGRIR